MRILKYNPGENSLKVQFMIYSDLECLLKKYTHVKMILKNLLQRKKLSIHLQVIHGLHTVHLMYQKTNLVITEEKTIWECFVKT